MRLAQVDGAGLAVVDGDEVVLVAEADGRPFRLSDVLAGGEPALAAVAEAVGRPGSSRVGLTRVRLRAPLERPGKIVAAPVNYVNHMVEMSEVIDIRSLGVFLKAPTSVTGPGGVVRLPYTDRRVDQEGELAVVIGQTAHDLPPEEALSVVFGYTCLLDITMRGGEDRSLRKSFDTFTPLGPWLVTADEVGDPERLDLTCSVNGTVRQAANTRELIWGVARLVSYVSSAMTLEPGDVIATGTPQGVGPLAHGDTVEVTIERIGSLSVSVSAAGAVTCPTAGANRGPVPPPPPDR
ncbi:MAG TPA: fumarylacetoacetate hydrolase family protein [Mycobacteriales bacterium]|nr:fumarylacetoacetate hydrolase family protein [Mycobacteriales bacterium]